MIEINLENKTKFFAMNIGQEFIHIGTGKAMRGLPKKFELNYENLDKLQLLCFSTQRSVLLKPLSSISDEDVNFLIKKYDITIGNDFLEDYETLNDFKKSLLDIGDDYCHTIDFFDDLRSKGYALPWMGLSVDDMVQAGWTKLKEVKNENS